MRRFAMKDYGEAKNVFTEIEAQPRTVDESHVRIQILAFGVNPYDVSVRQGTMKDFRPLKFPYVLGNDSAGIVTEIGSEVKNIEVGDAVIAHSVGGANGEELVVPANKVVKKPNALSFVEGAAAVTPWLTAYNMVTHLLGAAIGEKILVQGASGAVGSLLVQLLKANGKNVSGTASSKNAEYVKNLGVDQFIPYDQENVGEKFPNHFDTVIDATKGGRSTLASVQAMKEKGNYVGLIQLPEDQSKAGNYFHFGPAKEYSDVEALTAFVKLFLTQQVSVKIAQVYPFELASLIEAHETLEGHPPAGKLVLAKEMK